MPRFGEDGMNIYRALGKGLGAGLRAILENIQDEKLTLDDLRVLAGRFTRHDIENRFLNTIDMMVPADLKNQATKNLLKNIIVKGFSNILETSGNALAQLSAMGGIESDDPGYRNAMQEESKMIGLPGDDADGDD